MAETLIAKVSVAGRYDAGPGNPLLFIAGPCVLESEDIAMSAAGFLSEIADRLGIQVVFKGSFDKANRSSASSGRGPGIAEGLRILSKVKERFGFPVTTDIHEPGHAARVAPVVDIIQIPAFLCRQTDLLLAAAKTGLPVNIKKGQFMAPWDMRNAVEKVMSAGNNSVLVTERGATFGYNNLVVDYRGMAFIRESLCPVIFDATHSVQLPGGAGTASSGERKYVGCLARAAVAAGVDGIFLEIHPDPARALSDGPNSLPFAEVEPLLRTLLSLRAAVEQGEPKKREK